MHMTITFPYRTLTQARKSVNIELTHPGCQVTRGRELQYSPKDIHRTHGKVDIECLDLRHFRQVGVGCAD